MRSQAAINDLGNCEGSTPYVLQPPTPSATPANQQAKLNNHFTAYVYYRIRVKCEVQGGNLRGVVQAARYAVIDQRLPVNLAV